ncbi:hypothetical protein COU38_01725 [Candidatus Micrarchaeota archaeon CG10_big_fil_rev_8_21_14_0_10_54_18]|nr:MAG: hypothetical protein COU38_01725 [Candidatus Micrarchaeota archaeon CG10_big_fil_rev_8_21_14_0_10_54_18]
MNVDELFEKGLLKKVVPSKERAKKSLKVARKYLDEAETILNVRAYNAAVMSAYASVFHSARAILFVDGVGERSHYAVGRYLSEKHADLGTKWINAFHLYRRLRHATAYGLDTTVEKEDAEKAIVFARGFLEKVGNYLKMGS